MSLCSEFNKSRKRFNTGNFDLYKSSFYHSLNNINDSKDNMIIENFNKIETPKSKKHFFDEVLIEDILYKKSLWIHYNKRYAKFFSQ